MNKRKLKKLIKKSNNIDIYAFLYGRNRTKSSDITFHKYGIRIENCVYIPYYFIERVIYK